jgi:hypothetical protein
MRFFIPFVKKQKKEKQEQIQLQIEELQIIPQEKIPAEEKIIVIELF